MVVKCERQVSVGRVGEMEAKEGYKSAGRWHATGKLWIAGGQLLSNKWQ